MKIEDFIILLSCAYLTNYIYLCIYRQLSNNKIEFHFKEYAILFVISILTVINNIYNPMILKVLFSMLLYIIFFKVVFKNNYIVTTYYVVIITLLSITIDLLFAVILSSIVSNVYNLNSLPIFKFLYSCMYIYIVYFIFNIKWINRTINKIKSFWKLKKDFTFLIVINVIVINLLLILYSVNYLDYKYYLTVFLISGIIILFITSYINSIYNNKILRLKNLYLESSINSYSQIIAEYRLLKHNLLNDLIFIRSFSTKSGKVFVDQKINKYNKEFLWINNLKNIPKGIQGLIYTKYVFSKNNNIDIYVDNKLIIEENKMSSKTYMDLSEIIGIVLDNAIEASIESEKKIIYISFFTTKNHIFIEIINTFSNSIDLDKIGLKEYSTKFRSSGYGLNYIYNLNKDITIKSRIIDNLFKIVIKVKKNNKKKNKY